MSCVVAVPVRKVHFLFNDLALPATTEPSACVHRFYNLEGQMLKRFDKMVKFCVHFTGGILLL